MNQREFDAFVAIIENDRRDAISRHNAENRHRGVARAKEQGERLYKACVGINKAVEAIADYYGLKCSLEPPMRDVDVPPDVYGLHLGSVVGPD